MAKEETENQEMYSAQLRCYMDWMVWKQMLNVYKAFGILPKEPKVSDYVQDK